MTDEEELLMLAVNVIDLADACRHTYPLHPDVVRVMAEFNEKRRQMAEARQSARRIMDELFPAK